MQRPAYALATILILLGVALFSAGSLVTVSTLESKISVSQREGINAYEVAEAGVQDALWRLQNNDSSCGNCATALQNGTLNYTYTAANSPHTSQSFKVTMVSTVGQTAGNGTITVVGTVTSGNLTAQRQIISRVYNGTTSFTTNNAMMSNGTVAINNGTSTVQINGGDMYSSGSISFSHAKVSLSNKIEAQGTYTATSSTVTQNGINASNYAPAPTVQQVPSFDFTSQGHVYTPASFQTAVRNSSNPSFGSSSDGYITYINGSLTLGTWANNKNITIYGMLIINGSFSTASSLSNANITVNDNNNGKAGIFSSGSMAIYDGNFNNINGVIYSGGSMKIYNKRSMQINGGLVATGALEINASNPLNVTFDSNRMSKSFTASGSGAGSSVLQVKHIEEQY